MRRLKLTTLAFAALFSSQLHAETVFVTLEKDNAIAVLDPVEAKLIKTVNVGQRPRGIALSPDHKQLFIATSDDNTIRIFDASSLKELGRLPSGEDPETFALSPDGKLMYVSN